MSRINKRGHSNSPLRILVTSGPTREFIDPIRFISNSSTGIFGYEIAAAAIERGHKVILISGPTYLPPPRRVKFIPVLTALEMKAAIKRFYSSADCLIMAAAVSDYRPAKCVSRKIKRTDERLLIELKRNPDILFEMGKRKGNRILVGFSAETEDLIRNAKQKLRLKDLDLIVATLLRKKNPPFGDKMIRTVMIGRDGKIERFFSSKGALSRIILDKVEKI